MHDPNAEGMAFFRCDYCGSAWSDDRPMVEGHRGSLICAKCLTLAYTSLVLEGEAVLPPKNETCRLCLSRDDERAHWRSPIDESAWACVSCVKRSAGVLARDPDIDWAKPTR